MDIETLMWARHAVATLSAGGERRAAAVGGAGGCSNVPRGAGKAATMGALTEREAGTGWFVEVKTGRVVRRSPVEAHTGGTGAARQPAEVTPIMAENELDPREDLKVAKEFIQGMNPLKALKEALMEGAELLDPAEADPRMIVPEPDTVSEMAEDGPGGKPLRPREAHPMPDAKELGKEHRGY
jgi:hypothetical protein